MTQFILAVAIAGYFWYLTRRFWQGERELPVLGLTLLPETISVMVKLVGVTLATILAIVGSVGWVVAPADVAAYRKRFIADSQTLRFTPRSTAPAGKAMIMPSTH